MPPLCGCQNIGMHVGPIRSHFTSPHSAIAPGFKWFPKQKPTGVFWQEWSWSSGLLHVTPQTHTFHIIQLFSQQCTWSLSQPAQITYQERFCITENSNTNSTRVTCKALLCRLQPVLSVPYVSCFLFRTLQASQSYTFYLFAKLVSVYWPLKNSRYSTLPLQSTSWFTFLHFRLAPEVFAQCEETESRRQLNTWKCTVSWRATYCFGNDQSRSVSRTSELAIVKDI